jgi:rubredoxin/uncharacterized membrane protein
MIEGVEIGMKEWQCTVCGYIHKGDEPPKTCPICGADSSKFVRIDQLSDPEKQEPVPQAQADISSLDEKKQWQCTVCGYIHEGAQPPDECPVCGADKSKFILLETSQDDEPESGKTAADARGQSGPETARSNFFNTAFITRLIKPDAAIYKTLTALHGHPISVHIPNGVLPLAVLFTMAAAFFDSASFATAAKFNMFFITLFMPVVIFTGLVDWTNRFNASMTKVFKVKMACAAIVLVISAILSLWWLIQPGVYLSTSGGSVLFLLLNVMDLFAAALAGWYGGKLVFPKPGQ